MILALLIAAAASTASPAPEGVDFTSRTGEAGKTFPYIEHFLKLPPAEHTDFTVAYYFRREGRPSGDAGAVLTDAGVQVPLPVAPDGRFLALPTLAQVRNHDLVTFNVPDRTPMRVRIGLAPLAPPSTSMDAAAVVRAINQANAAIHRLAGPFGVAVPRLKKAVFDSAEGGAAVLADGTIVALPANKDGLYYEPSKLKNAVTLTFTRAGGHIDIQ